MKYKLIDFGKIKSDTIFINRKQIIKFYKELMTEKDFISGFICPIKKEQEILKCK